MKAMDQEPAFGGTLDPFHGAHIGQLLRAHRFKPFSQVSILLNKHPAHKPNATDWRHRRAMAELTLAAFEPPFAYTIKPVENMLAKELPDRFDYKIIGVDALLDDLADERRWVFAQRWPMLVLSVPGIADAALSEAYQSLPAAVQQTISYEYVGEADVPILNYDFEAGASITRRIHSTGLRAGQDQSLLPAITRAYIEQHQLYRATEG